MIEKHSDSLSNTLGEEAFKKEDEKETKKLR